MNGGTTSPGASTSAGRATGKRGTLGDIFRLAQGATSRAAPARSTAPQPAANPPRRGWRPGRGRPEPRREPPGSAAAKVQYFPSPDVMRPSTPPPSPPSSDPWDDEPYAAAPNILAPDTADDGGWDADAPSRGPGWHIVEPVEPEARPRRGVISGSLSSFRNRGPMVPLDEISQLAVPQNYRMLPRPPRSALQRLVQGTNSRLLNLLLIALVLCILAIPVVIGLHHLQVTQPTLLTPNTPAPTAVPTPTLAPGFAGFENNRFSIAYPTDWTHSSRASSLTACTCSRIEDFVSQGNAGSNEEVYVGTAKAVPSDELAQLIDEAARIRLLSQEVLQPLAPNLHKTYDQQQWIENDYTYTHLQGNTNVVIEVRALVVDVGATTYFIVAYAPQASFGSANATHLEPMLQSFRFQGA